FSEFFQPIISLFLAFVALSQSISGLKYSRRPLASIFLCPVIFSIASGHGLEDPNSNST
ncbi:GSCOCG00005974001-RA-CDS, partial [Cotesia congregata]